MKYTHLTQDERYQIAILEKAGHDKSNIARVMNRNKSTIGREMVRNRGKRGYQAIELADHTRPAQFSTQISPTMITDLDCISKHNLYAKSSDESAIIK